MGTSGEERDDENCIALKPFCYSRNSLAKMEMMQNDYKWAPGR